MPPVAPIWPISTNRGMTVNPYEPKTLKTSLAIRFNAAWVFTTAANPTAPAIAIAKPISTPSPKSPNSSTITRPPTMAGSRRPPVLPGRGRGQHQALGEAGRRERERRQ